MTPVNTEKSAPPPPAALAIGPTQCGYSLSARNDATIPSSWAMTARHWTPSVPQYRPPASTRCSSAGTYRHRRSPQSRRKMAIHGAIHTMTPSTKMVSRLVNDEENTA